MKNENAIRVKKTSNFKEQLPMILLAVPFFTFFLVFTVIPIVSSMVLSFTSYDMLSLPKFAGIDNYMRMFVQDDVFGTVVKNTIALAVVVGPAGFMLAFLLAWIVNEFSTRLRILFSFMCYALSLVGNAYFIWKIAFSGDSYGYINSMLLSIGITTEPIVWLKSPQYLFTIVVIVQLWQSMGVSFLSNISGLQNVNRDLYEAGAIDGIKNRWQELRYITLPSMSHMLLFSAVMQIQSSFSISAVAVELAGYPSVQHSVDTIVTHMADMATVRYELGYASSIAVILFLMMAFTRFIIGKVLNMVSK